ncbi:unnamed protein product [Blepharisma stoltei]|uniref:Uncharacterized protein n=1 Tax=Blepharisma stoltei TaxID=1481888 RepID=A0AAU9IQN9_9CILI|nr:unnamed protein product [Blepharisma stoltei]
MDDSSRISYPFSIEELNFTSNNKSHEQSELVTVHNSIIKASSEISRLRKDRKAFNNALNFSQSKCESLEKKVFELHETLRQMNDANILLKGQLTEMHQELSKIDELKIIMNEKDLTIQDLQLKLSIYEKYDFNKRRETDFLQSIYQAGKILKRELKTEETQPSQTQPSSKYYDEIKSYGYVLIDEIYNMPSISFLFKKYAIDAVQYKDLLLKEEWDIALLKLLKFTFDILKSLEYIEEVKSKQPAIKNNDTTKRAKLERFDISEGLIENLQTQSKRLAKLNEDLTKNISNLRGSIKIGKNNQHKRSFSQVFSPNLSSFNELDEKLEKAEQKMGDNLNFETLIIDDTINLEPKPVIIPNAANRSRAASVKINRERSRAPTH